MIEIIVPVYNTSQDILDKTLTGIINQTYKNWKLWIIDDGSTKEETINCLNAWRSHTKSENVIIVRKENGGVSSARNEALSRVDKNSFIAYCDADDIWAVNHLEKSIEALEQGYDVTYCNPIIVDINGQKLFPTFPLYNKFDKKYLRIGNFIYPSTIVHRPTDPVEFFDSELNSLEDYDLCIRFAQKNMSFIQRNDSTVTYLSSPGQGASRGHLVLDKIKKKHGNFITGSIKLNLGCGNEVIPEFLGCDLFEPGVDLSFDCAKIPFNSCVDEIRAYHLIEHFDFMEGQGVLKEWHRALKPGGRLHLETPDLLETCKEFARQTEDKRIILYGHFWAWPWLPGQAHRFLFTETQLFWQLSQVGFTRIKRLPPDSIYCNNPYFPNSLYLNVEAFK